LAKADHGAHVASHQHSTALMRFGPAGGSVAVNVPALPLDVSVRGHADPFEPLCLDCLLDDTCALGLSDPKKALP